MPIQDSDLLLIEDTSGVSKKIEASKLKANLAANTYNNYKLLVNKPDYRSRFVYAQNMQASVGLTDYMLVERAGVSYKVTGQQIIDYFPSVPAGAAGPITDSTVDGKLTLASEANLDLFTVGDAINMVDEDGDVASYTPVTSTIANVNAAVIDNIDGYKGSPAPNYEWINAFNGTVLGNGVNGTNNNTGYEVIFKEPLGVDDLIEVVVNTGSSTYQSEPKFTYDNLNTTPSGNVVWNTNYGPTVSVEMEGRTVYKKTLNNTEPVTGFRHIDAPQTLGIFVNGFLLDYVNPVTTLTFASPNKDLKYFNPGDNVNSITKEFVAVTYNGNGTSQLIKTGFSPSLVWLKNRDYANGHQLFDTIRGDYTALESNGTAGNDVNTNKLAFIPGGFTLNGSANCNGRVGDKYIAWCWDAGNTTVTNNAGTIESQVRSNGNFSVVKYTATGKLDTVGHGLLTGAPKMIFVKKLTAASWNVYHESIGATQVLELNATQAAATAQSWGNTPPSGSVFTVGDYPDTNSSAGAEYIAYAWAETPGVSSFGEYSGGTAGKVIDCGFEPGLVIIKRSSSAQSWAMYDSARSPSNPRRTTLACDTGGAEVSSTDRSIDFTSTGFTVVGTNDVCNKPGETYVYAAFVAGVVGPEVVSTDIAANSMVVSGGAWKGSDGSDSGLGFFSMSLKNPAGDALQYQLTAPTIVRVPDYELYADTVVIETITANSAGTLDLNLHSTIWNSTYVITLNGGTTTSFPLSGNIINGSTYVPQFVFSNAGDSVEIEYTFLSTGTVTAHVLHYANDPANNKKVQWNGTNVLFDGTDQNVEINGTLPGGGSGPAETEVTGPAKSGTGNFSSRTGPVVDVTNSNQEWIDNDNRLGEEFFIKSASTRTGLAILRAEAIKIATAYDPAKAPYPVRSLVIYEGDYYVSAGLVGPGQDRWIDLGRTVNN